jgi:hypothetical protein
MPKTNSGEFFTFNSIIFFSYFISWLLTFEISKIQNSFGLPFDAEVAALIFLPHGIRVLSICLMGIKSIPILLLASWATGSYYLSFTDAIILTSVSIIALLISFPILKIPKNGLGLKDISYLLIIKVAVVTSITSSILNVIAKYFLKKSLIENMAWILPAHVLGDIVGSIICFYAIGKIYTSLKKVS